MNNILSYLDELFPNPKCELNYNKPYELLLAIVLSAQTTDKRVNQVTEILFSKYNTLEKLKDAKIEQIEQIIKPIGTYKKKAIFIHEIATILYNNDGIIPRDSNFLESLPGVGRKTTNVYLSIIEEIPAIAVDTHVARVSKRLKLAQEHDNVLEIERKLMKKIPKERWSKTHHQLVLFGRYYCKAIKRECKKLCVKLPIHGNKDI